MTAPHIKILSTGAPKVGIARCAEAFCESRGCSFEVRFVTAPVLRQEVAGGVADDIVNGPLAAQADFEAAGQVVAGTTVPIGSVQAAVVVPAGAPAPDLASIEGLAAGLRAARRVIYNRATSGEYIAQVIDRLGLTAEIAHKTEQVPSGSAVMEALAAMPGENAIGFGQTTEIRRLEHLGARLVGPLPGELDKTTTYGAALNANATAPDVAREFLDFLAGPDARDLLAASGLA